MRAIGDSIWFCPPLIIAEAPIDGVVARFAQSLEDTTARVASGMLTA